jgi:hypothetical protein
MTIVSIRIGRRPYESLAAPKKLGVTAWKARKIWKKSQYT